MTKRTIGSALAVVLAGAGAIWVGAHWGIGQTDDAQLQSHLYQVSSRIAGTVDKVLVDAHDPVQPGQPLVPPTSLLSPGRNYHRAHPIEAARALSQQWRLRLLQFEQMLHARGADPQLAHRRALELVDRQVDLQASLLAYADIFHLLAILFLAAIPLVLLLRAPKAPQAG